MSITRKPKRKKSSAKRSPTKVEWSTSESTGCLLPCLSRKFSEYCCVALL
jgi:hypothetical protein